MNKVITCNISLKLLKRSAVFLFALVLLISCTACSAGIEKLSGELTLMTFVPRELLGNEKEVYFFGDLDFDTL